MKLQLLTCVLISSISSNPIRSSNKQNFVVHRHLYSDDSIRNFESSDQYNSRSYKVSQLGEEDSLEEQNLEYENSLTNLFTQIEELNSLLEEGGDNFDIWGSLKSVVLIFIMELKK
ncbi:hypothetical protein CONCODRAFT_14208 [Conidiobolus coronatus NRRL 28638]|uniref:Uncharacterized protein n=1 Tax=Conidiobolus coronatus (strain ATCC 28846 / CBS 209.66 / NRRL 28638) TaxID=796925 RepID=A0A137NPE8_CONC2|nr:hypothetical protein CONCODRAFT_14208 [Conidiobolus coronatus NRRL 28638]|eukprot:KXN64620.1 hypothetical protein CONCODRAFT_14208 [Conidiobolus coronatus NRRL 28638]